MSVDSDYDNYFELVRDNIAEGARRFDSTNGDRSDTWLCVMAEEQGKIARAINKLRIIPNTTAYYDERSKWKLLLKHSLITTAAIAARMYIKELKS